MFKKKYLFFGILLCFLITLTGSLIIMPLITGYYTRRMEHLERMEKLHYLLCESLEAGMTKDEVFSTLKQTGDFTMAGNDIGPFMDLYIVFKDSKNKEVYGSFNITFFHYKYNGAYVTTGFEHIETLCEFY
jgi:hypothetical protein